MRRILVEHQPQSADDLDGDSAEGGRIHCYALDECGGGEEYVVSKCLPEPRGGIPGEPGVEQDDLAPPGVGHMRKRRAAPDVVALGREVLLEGEVEEGVGRLRDLAEEAAPLEFDQHLGSPGAIHPQLRQHAINRQLQRRGWDTSPVQPMREEPAGYNAEDPLLLLGREHRAGHPVVEQFVDGGGIELDAPIWQAQDRAHS